MAIQQIIPDFDLSNGFMLLRINAGQVNPSRRCSAIDWTISELRAATLLVPQVELPDVAEVK